MFLRCYHPYMSLYMYKPFILNFIFKPSPKIPLQNTMTHLFNFDKFPNVLDVRPPKISKHYTITIKINIKNLGLQKIMKQVFVSNLTKIVRVLTIVTPKILLRRTSFRCLKDRDNNNVTCAYYAYKFNNRDKFT